jgi:hypothetical protein
MALIAKSASSENKPLGVIRHKLSNIGNSLKPKFLDCDEMDEFVSVLKTGKKNNIKKYIELIQKIDDDNLSPCGRLLKKVLKPISKTSKTKYANIKHHLKDDLKAISERFWELEPTLAGKKPACYLDNNHAMESILALKENAKLIYKKSNGNIRVLSTAEHLSEGQNPMLMIFNVKRLKKTVLDNYDFYKHYFPNAKNANEIIDMLTCNKSPLIGYKNELLRGVTLGFPLPDSVLYCRTITKHVDAMKFLSSNPEWSIHKQMLEGKLPLKRSDIDTGCVLYNPKTKAAEEWMKLMARIIHDLDSGYNKKSADELWDMVKKQ